MAYFTGPNTLDCAPIRNSNPISAAVCLARSAAAAASMIRISASLIRRISALFSARSQSWPAVAENRKKGRMNRPAAALISRWPSPPWASSKAIRMISAFL